MTTSSSKPLRERAAAAAAAAERATPSHARFIPREELQGFAAWTPDAFGAAAPRPDAPAPAPGTPTPAELLHEQLHAARQAGYQDGYRDGLVALDSFKRSFATQVTSQVGALMQRFDGELQALERDVAQALVRTATELARQVVRSELATRPELVARVAEDAVAAVLLSARHLRVLVHPDDHALVAEGAGESLHARGARLVAAPEIARGGCVVESDLGQVDARIDTRWAQAAAALGQELAWSEGAPGGDAA